LATFQRGLGMTKKSQEATSAPVMFRLDESLLESLPPTDPAVLKTIEDARRGNIHFAAIGRVAALWAHFEALIDAWLMTFSGLEEEISVCFTGQMLGSRPRVDAFIALVRQLGADRKWVGVLEAFAKDVQGLQEQRNRAIHDVWQMTDTERPQRREASARRVVRILSIHVPTRELIALAGNIDKLRERFDAIAQEILSGLSASPDKV
jgi:hypothetical protein